ncbi:MAG: MBL fold metallo-hydrolase, partial [Ktedonobacteraceae bacterium]|nr:MBL fold metallo-hydrolase [Ktedonobacteraceae bacterium]
MNPATNRPALSSIALGARQVHTITDRFAMTNTYLVEGEQLIVVDPSSATHVHLLCDYLERVLHRSPREIRLVVLTHLHLDHTAGLHTLLERCDAPVAASRMVRELVGARRRYGLPPLPHIAGQMLPRMLDQLDLFLPAYERQMKYITTWLDDVDGLPVDANWRVIASPGHTPDSLCLYNPF